MTKAIPPLDERSREKAMTRQLKLTKPTGALGRLETLSTDLAAMQATANPSCERVTVLLFAGDHGVAAQGVSAYPQAVTAQMCLNFCRGGAAVNVLARQVGATVMVIDVGVCEILPPHDGLVLVKVAAGTADFTVAPAMSEAQCAKAMQVGATQVKVAIDRDAQVLVLGEMGIANTTSASALLAAYTGLPVDQCVGRGTGISDEVLNKKLQVVQAGLSRHAQVLADARGVLVALGGLEIAAMVGAMMAAAQHRVPIVVDGFISSAAALAAIKIEPAVKNYLIWAHRSAEGPHAALLQYLQAQPLLDLGMRLGEGSGGVLAIHVLRAACRTLNRRKRAGQLVSKGRFLSAQMLAYLDDDVWLSNAKRANSLAQVLAKGLQQSNRVRLSNPVQANEVFAIMPRRTYDAVIAKGAYFYEWPMEGLAADEVHCRFVLSFATPEQHVKAFLDLMREHG